MDKELAAKQVLRDAEQKKIQACKEEIAKVLEKYNCKLDTEFFFRSRW